MKEQLKAAEKLVYKEQYPAAIEKLKEALIQDDESADAWNLLGFASRKSGDLDTAKDAYSRALVLNGNHLGALQYQGELFITLGQIDNAKTNLTRLNDVCPSGCEEQAELAAAIVAAE